MLNGDHVWNQYVKKNLKKDYKEGKKSRVKNAYGGGPNIRGANGAKVMRALAFNIMDVKQLLDYTKGRLNILQTQMLGLPDHEED